MLPFKYAFKHMRRSLLSCLAAIAASLIFTLLLCELNYSLQTQKTQLDDMYDSISVNCVVSDLTGTKLDHLDINPTYVDACTNPVYEISLYIKDVCFKRRLRYNAMIPNTDPVIANLSEAPFLTGISMLKADSSLLPQNGVVVEFFDGFDESDLNSDKMICIVPSDMISGDASNEDMKLTLAVTHSNNVLNEEPIAAELIIAGTYTGIVADENSIYCSWGAVCALAVESGDVRIADSLSFTVEDNRKLDEFKEILWKYFSPVDITAGSNSIYSFAITVNDSVLTDSVSSIERNISLLNILIPLLLVASVGIGFVTSLILTRNRKPEFAVMRSMGTRRGTVFFVAFAEQLILGIAGTLLGVIGYSITRGFATSPNFEQLAIYIGCYIIGAAAAVIRITTINVMEIMKVKE